MRLSKLKQRILVTLPDTLDTMRVHAIVLKVSSSYPAVWRSLRRLERDGLVERNDRGAWAPTGEGIRIGRELRNKWASEQSKRTASLPLQGIMRVLRPWLEQSTMKDLKEFVLWVIHDGTRLDSSRDPSFWRSISSKAEPILVKIASEEDRFMDKYAEVWNGKTSSERRSLLKRLGYYDSVIEEWVGIPFNDIRRSGRLKVARLLSDPGSRSYDSQEDTKD